MSSKIKLCECPHSLSYKKIKVNVRICNTCHLPVYKEQNDTEQEFLAWFVQERLCNQCNIEFEKLAEKFNNGEKYWE